MLHQNLKNLNSVQPNASLLDLQDFKEPLSLGLYDIWTTYGFRLCVLC